MDGCFLLAAGFSCQPLGSLLELSRVRAVNDGLHPFLGQLLALGQLVKRIEQDRTQRQDFRQHDFLGAPSVRFAQQHLAHPFAESAASGQGFQPRVFFFTHLRADGFSAEN